MSGAFIHTVFGLALFWTILHIIAYTLGSRNQSFNTLLPSSSAHPLRRNPSRKSTRLSLRKLVLTIETTSHNALHDALTRKLVRVARIKQTLRVFYDLGVVISVIGMLGALALLTWTTAQYTVTLSRSFHSVWAHDTQSTIGDRIMAKRAAIPVNYSTNEPKEPTPFGTPQPIIPGLTVPLNHTPVILLSVLICQVIHEFGHAFAAALDQLPISSTGLSLAVILPSAFVSFPASYLSSLPSKSTARITAAGPFHNFIFWCFLLLAASTGIGQSIQSLCGYKDITRLGRVVLDVDADSPLYEHLPPGTLITRLDDTIIGDNNSANDNWASYLSNKHQLPLQGWCIGTEHADATTTCCNANTRQLGEHLACFVSSTPSWKGCLDPVPLLTTPQNVTRCSSTSGCPTEHLCVHPHTTEHLLRITASQSWKEDDHYIILWRGPREEIMEEVHVGKTFPSFSFLPVSLPGMVGLLFEYLELVTLSLFVFNLLPLSGLDGNKFFQHLIKYSVEKGSIESAEAYDVESLERPHIPPKSSSRSSRIRRAVPTITMSMLAFCTIFAVMRLWVEI